MEDIYGDLLNYENVNSLQELRVDNKVLKLKVEELTAGMAKLQKEILQDFDTLDNNFKTLHKNYHSLLTTARAEVKRKTERITQLNAEKDAMVLDSLKKGNLIRRNLNHGGKNPRMNYDSAPEGRNHKNNKENVKKGKGDTEHERRDTPRNARGKTPPKDADPDAGSGTSIRNKSDIAGEKEELSNNRKSNVIENIAQHKTEHNAPSKASTRSIKDRRKSMPAGGIPLDVFSSDDEQKRNYQTKETRTDHLRSDNERRNINKMSIDRFSNKPSSETTGVDDKGHSNPESTLRDNYKGRSNRHLDSTTYRGRDKYEMSLKYRKQYSPERGQKRQHREHQDDYYRHERGRYQGSSLESLPPECIYKSYNHRQSQRSAHRSDYDRYSHDHEKYRHHHDSKYSSKYRLTDQDEPLNKRQRTESYGNPAHSKEGWRHHERESMDVQPVPCFSPHEYDMLRFSCQSPDFVHTDAASADPVKEIMGTAATPLEDPRVTSKRYVIWKENGVETLSTAVGRNIDVRPVNKAEWDIKHVDTPVALVRPPSECSDTLVNYIYGDIDNPVTNLDLAMETGGTDDVINVIRSKPKKIQHDAQDFKISELVPEELSKQATDVEKVSQPNKANYRIPKIGQNNKNTHIKIDVPVIDIDENVPLHKNVYKKGAIELLPKNKKYSKTEGNKKSRSRERSANQNQATLSKIALVANDLELSDEHSDHKDTNRSVVSEKLQKNCEMPLNMNKASTDDSVNSVVNKTLTNSHNTEIENQTVNTAEIKDVAGEEKTKELDITKKQKSKKKKSKSKEEVETTADDIHVPEQKPKSKKEKESKPKETKEKFSELFGDSNSLMTPEDLGIPSYLPICEDAQDAVDMKINQIIDASPLIDKDEIPDTQTQNRVEVKIKETKAHDDIPKAILQISNTDVDDREVLNEIKKKKSSKMKEVTVDPNLLPSPIIYEILNPGTDSNDPNVRTLIISKGIQPEITYENKMEETKPATDVEVNAIQNTKDIHLFPATKVCQRDILTALATSTPQKEFSPVNPLQADVAKTDVICDPRVRAAVASIPNAVQVVNQTEQNTLEDNDAPDVRIFVKRRRKGVKRPPMTE